MFRYQITPSDKTVLPITFALYIFNSLIDSQYNDTKFKELLIDSNILTRSIEDNSQLKALVELNNFIQFNNNMTESANFIFEIETNVSIRLVNLDILLGLIQFHIVRVNILFLLCLADINKHGAFFNNIINQVIQSQIQSGYFHPVI